MRELKPRPPATNNGAARTPKFRIARGRNWVVGWVNRIIAGMAVVLDQPHADVTGRPKGRR